MIFCVGAAEGTVNFEKNTIVLISCQKVLTFSSFFEHESGPQQTSFAMNLDRFVRLAYWILPKDYPSTVNLCRINSEKNCSFINISENFETVTAKAKKKKEKMYLHRKFNSHIFKNCSLAKGH